MDLKALLIEEAVVGCIAFGLLKQCSLNPFFHQDDDQTILAVLTRLKKSDLVNTTNSCILCLFVKIT